MPPRSESTDLLRLRFYSAVTRARHRIVLIRRESDGEGRRERPSVVWEDALDVYRVPGEPYDESFESRIASVTLSRSEVPENAASLTSERGSARRQAAALSLGAAPRETLDSALAIEVVSADKVFSATEIEAYLQCPYRWFFERVVRPAEIDREFDARELGTHAHELLAEVYGRLRGASIARVTAGNLEEALRECDRLCLEQREGAGAGSLAEELGVRRAERWVRSVLIADAGLFPGFEPREFEFRFAEQTALEFAGERFRGQVDRIDTDGSRAIVTDYKSGRAIVGAAKFGESGRVQAVIYAAAVEKALGLSVAASVYRSLSSGQLAGFWRADQLEVGSFSARDAVDEEGFRKLVEDTEEVVAGAIAGMRAGRIERVPRIRGACGYCAIKQVCEGAE
jgi:RecB family exonuclease